jgi:hypothetical protein
MSTKRQPSKQKRQAQNRAQRAALEARRAAAHAEGSGSSAATGGGGSFLSRLRGGPGAGGTGGGTSARPSGRERRAAVASALPIGQRAAISAVLAALAALFAAAILIRVPVDASGELYTPASRTAEWIGTVVDTAAAAPDATAAEIVSSIDDWSPDADERLLAVAIWPFSVTYVLPVIGAAIGLRAVTRRASARTVNRTVFATLFGALLTQNLFLLYLPAVISLGVAAFQIRKSELAEARDAMAEGGADWVIDVEEAAADVDPTEGEVLEAEVVDTDVVSEGDLTEGDVTEGDDEPEWAEGEHPPK